MGGGGANLEQGPIVKHSYNPYFIRNFYSKTTTIAKFFILPLCLLFDLHFLVTQLLKEPVAKFIVPAWGKKLTLA